MQSALRVHNVHFISESDANTSVQCCVHLLACQLQLQSGVYTVSTYREEGGVGVKPKDHTHSG